MWARSAIYVLSKGSSLFARCKVADSPRPCFILCLSVIVLSDNGFLIFASSPSFPLDFGRNGEGTFGFC
ncbi:hypothetical protein N658DRAFT_288929 [Parathielavia hyrcaniae]|uniref:Uncharacterized protein n=1 Tax=Parathielavia hyrcaniae TaxID=113614 RepID=A0AAN6PT86_9PEZI|nr:hypothetical protein N658DRAFT_288929 [Parathielavia hyrcaniae]